MELNDNGRAFYRFGKSIQTEYSHLKKELKALSGFREKTVRLGATNYIGVYLMPQIINSFKQEHPEIIISFTMDFCLTSQNFWKRTKWTSRSFPSRSSSFTTRNI